MNLRRYLEERLSAVLNSVTGSSPAGKPFPALVGPSARKEFGDYQANGVMAAAKALKTNPRKLAEQVVASSTGVPPVRPPGVPPGVELGRAEPDPIEKLDVAGPGFINIRLSTAWMAHQLSAMRADPLLGAERPAKPQTIVVDYSAPNLAKEMHVGHLRSTIIGDALARILEFLGHKVIRQNHVGDWGTQFGMLARYLVDVIVHAKPDLRDLEAFYVKAKAKYDSDPEFASSCREYVVRLQSGDETVRHAWTLFRHASLEHCRQVYRRLGVLLNDAHIVGESFYGGVSAEISTTGAARQGHNYLPEVIADLNKAGLLKESQGAQCVFLDQFKAKDGGPLPLIVQKSDEGYLYATTDLAALRYRVGTLKAERILYVTDSRQGLHFQMVFAAARQAGFVPDDVKLEHVAFGTMMGPDGKPFKTRTGGTVKLMELLDEAEGRAYELVNAKNTEDVAKERAKPLSDEQKKHIAHVVGIGGVKYADLSQNRASDYVFSFDKMLSLDGNTAPYMQYAYARIRSIFRKVAADGGTMECGGSDAALDRARGTGNQHAIAENMEPVSAPIVLNDPAERDLALKLLQFAETLAVVAEDSLPNLLCVYLYDLAGAFTTFYENCPVLQSAPEIRASRLALCDLTARVIQTGLGLLGIQVVEQM